MEQLFDLFREAERLARRLGDTGRLNKIYSFLMQYHWAMGEQPRAIEYGERCLEAAEASNDLGLGVVGNYYLGHCYNALGQLERSVQCHTRILELLEGKPLTEQFGLSGLPYVVACAIAIWTLSSMGEFERAKALAARGLRVAETTQHPYSLAVLHINVGLMHVKKGEFREAVALLEPALQICREKHFAGWIMLSASFLGEAYALTGRPQEAIALYQEAIRTKEETITRVYFSVHWNGLAEALLLVGRTDEAREAAQRALESALAQGEQVNEAQARWMLGEVAARQARPARAEAGEQFEAAVRLCESLGLKPLLGRCWMSQGLLARKAGENDKGKELLQKAAALFRSLGMTWWEAGALKRLAP